MVSGHGLGKAEFEVFLRESAGRMMAVIRRILKDETESEDALQEAYLAAWRGRESFDGRSSMNTWMHRIATNTALNKLQQRRTLRAQLESGGDVEEAGVTRGGMAPEEKYALRELVWPVIERLPEDQRVVLVLRDVEGMSSEEVAEKLSITPAAVRQRLHRARKLVAETLEPELCGADELTCGGRLDLLLDLIDGLLAKEVKGKVEDHLAGCWQCRRYQTGFKQTVKWPKETAKEEVGVRETVKEWIMGVVGREG